MVLNDVSEQVQSVGCMYDVYVRIIKWALVLVSILFDE